MQNLRSQKPLKILSSSSHCFFCNVRVSKKNNNNFLFFAKISGRTGLFRTKINGWLIHGMQQQSVKTRRKVEESKERGSTYTRRLQHCSFFNAHTRTPTVHTHVVLSLTYIYNDHMTGSGVEKRSGKRRKLGGEKKCFARFNVVWCKKNLPPLLLPRKKKNQNCRMNRGWRVENFRKRRGGEGCMIRWEGVNRFTFSSGSFLTILCSSHVF